MEAFDSNMTTQGRRFRVALSFPGEKRAFVSQVAERLSQRLGRESVFYDAYYEAELARPDLELLAPILAKLEAIKDWDAGSKDQDTRGLRTHPTDLRQSRFQTTRRNGLYCICQGIRMKQNVAFVKGQVQSMTKSVDAITHLFRACEPNEALQPDDTRYVNCDDVRGDNLVQAYVRSLRRADPAKPEVKLFAGHRGVGKTCELNRIKASLEKPSSAENPYRPFQVIYMDATEKLDLNDLDLPDLLTFIAAEVVTQLRAANLAGFDPVSAYLTRIWDEIKGALKSEVALKDAGVETGFGSLTLELKNRPNSRHALRRAIEMHSTGLLGAVNDLLGTANVKLRQCASEGLVLIVDGLERLVFRTLEGGSSTHDRLFIERSEQLASLKTHTIYTVPISLFYSPRCAELEQTFGEHNVPVPMIRLHEAEEKTVSPESPGMRKMWEMIEARCRYAKVDVADVFDHADTALYLCEMTGGHPRHLMMFLQAAMNTVESLPITRVAAEKGVRNYANSLLREVPDEYWPKLRTFGTPQTDIPKDEAHQKMLLLLHVFEYMNGSPWYEVNPVIRTLARFQREGK